MNVKRCALSAAKWGRSWLLVLVAVTSLAGISSAQAIPGTLKSVVTTQTIMFGVCTETIRSSVWSFLDPQGATHNFPGKSLVTTITGGTPTTCPHTTTGSPLSTWSTDNSFYLTGTVTPAQLVVETVTAQQAYINPKYIVLGVTYAPPGSQSFVQYGDTETLGSSTMLGNMFTKGTGIKIAVSSTLKGSEPAPDMGGTFGVSDTTTNTFSTNFTDETDTSSSIAISSQSGWVNKVPGPANSYAGVDHDYDVIWLWLNPLLNIEVVAGPTTNLTLTGYGFDADDVEEMDIYGVYLGWLTGKLQVPGPGGSDLTPLMRTWAGLAMNGQNWPAGQSPSLVDPTDYAAIAASDPFSNPNYTVTVPTSPAGNLTSSDGRFTLTGNQPVMFQQPGPGGQPITQIISDSTTTTQTQGHGAKVSTTIGYSWENKFTGTLPFASWTEDVTLTDTLAFVNQWSVTNSQANMLSATGSVTGPPCVVVASQCSPVYSGPTQYEVFQDNVYNTFMFYPKP